LTKKSRSIQRYRIGFNFVLYYLVALFVTGYVPKLTLTHQAQV